MPDVYAISGAKGGVGKTTTAANLAATLAAAGHSVVAVDGDIGTPNLGPALGVTPGPDDPTIHDVLAGEATLSAAAYEGPHGIYVVPGRDDLDSFRRADPAQLGAALSSVSGVDYVIVDTSAGLTHESALPLSLADGVLLVTTPDRDALSATRKSLELTRELGGTVAGVAVNRAREDSADPEVGAPLLGRIPESRELAAGSAVGEPITVRSPEGDVALAFRRLASRLAVERVPPPPEVDDARGATADASGSDARGATADASGSDARGRDTARGADGRGGDDPDDGDGTPRREDVPRGAPGGAGPDTTQTATPRQDGSPDTEQTAESTPDTERTPNSTPQPSSETRGEPETEPEQDPDTEPAPDERIDDDGVIIRDDGDEEDPAAAEARRTVLGETVPESAISREETERGDAVEYEIDEDAIPFSEDETDDEEDDDGGGFLGRLFRS
jgi:septum site-determining protein MinD